MFGRIFFICIGLYMIYQGHPGWGLFSCIIGFGYFIVDKDTNSVKITYHTEEEKKDE